MRRRIAAVALGLAALVVATVVPAEEARATGPGPNSTAVSASTISERLARRLGEDPHPRHLIPVVVTMRSRPALSPPASGTSRRLRTRDVVAILKAKSRTSQVEILDQLEALAEDHEVAAIRTLWIADSLSFAATPATIRSIALRGDVERVDLDVAPILQAAIPEAMHEAGIHQAGRVHLAALLAAPVGPNLEPNLVQVGVAAAWARGFDGRGVVVASLDTGVDGFHPDLASRHRSGAGGWYDPYGRYGIPADPIGHGTQTLGVIVGGNESGSAVGVAPGARWIAARIFDDRGAATTSAIHAAYQWVLDPDRDPGTDDAPDVVNQSWTLAAGGCVLEFEPDLAALRAAGIVNVFAAGNAGPAEATSRSPANNPSAFAVGAIDAAQQPAVDSSRGPSSCADRVYPDVAAPGVDVVTTDTSSTWTVASGTSIAAPHVAGVVALMRQASPGSSVAAIEQALRVSARDLAGPGPDAATGAGQIDAAAAIDALAPRDERPPTVVPGAIGVLEPDAGSVRATLPVRLTRMSTDAVVLDWHTVDHTARAGLDHVGTTGTLVIPAGATTGVVDLEVLGDSDAEPTEALLVAFEVRTTAVLGGFGGLGIITIADNERRSVVAVADHPVISEGSGAGTRRIMVTLSLTTPATRDGSIEHLVRLASARRDDVVRTLGTSLVTRGDTSVAIPVDIVADALTEDDETFVIVLRHARGISIGGVARAVIVTIADDDAA